MEMTSVYALSSGVSALAGSHASTLLADWFLTWWHKRRLRAHARKISNNQICGYR